MARTIFGRSVAGLIVAGSVAGTFVGFSAYAMRPSSEITGAVGEPVEMHYSNKAAKSDRLPMRMQAALDTGAAYSLASAPQSADLARFQDLIDGIANANQASPQAEPPANAKAAAPVEAVNHAPASLPPQQKPQRPEPATTAGLLDDAQIAGLRSRLRLTADQSSYWPAVETALRDVANRYLRGNRAKSKNGGQPAIDVNSPEVQRLIWAAMPLLMRMREDQKNEVRKLARVIGLESVAKQI